MERLIGDPLKAIALVLAAVLVGTAFAGPGVWFLASIGLAIIGVLVAGQQFGLLPACHVLMALSSLHPETNRGRSKQANHADDGGPEPD